MNDYDKNNMFCAMVSWNMFDKWARDERCELPPHDVQKLNVISKTILELLRQFGKREGKGTLDALLEESKQFDFLIAERGKAVGEQVTGSFDDTMIKSAVKKLLDSDDMACVMCERTDYANCERYALYNLVDECKGGCKGCPFSKGILD